MGAPPGRLPYLTFRDMVRIAALVEVDEMAILTLVYQQYAADKKNKKKR